jgi:mannose-1-phosphate guanylyltransferase
VPTRIAIRGAGWGGPRTAAVPWRHVEPVGRDSAPAIALAALRLRDRFGDVGMGVFASDHRIDDAAAFERALRSAFELADVRRGLVTIGIRPTRPATGYGYIERGERVMDGFHVSRFVEKPNLTRARAYVDSGAYVWNAGMFVWNVDTILAELDRHAPELMLPLREAYAAGDVDLRFAELPKVSIDYAVMEKTDAAFVVEGRFDWDDIGDWAALERLLPKDDGSVHTVFGAHAGHDAAGNIVYTDGPDDVLVALGVEGLVIVKRGDTVLILPKERVGEIKELLEDERLRALVP